MNIVVMNIEASRDSWYHRFTVWVRVERIAHIGSAQYAKLFPFTANDCKILL
jgi:hypothetical protein